MKTVQKYLVILFYLNICKMLLQFKSNLKNFYLLSKHFLVTWLSKGN